MTTPIDRTASTERRTAWYIGLNVCLFVVGIGLTISATSERTTYPISPVKLVVPFSAGGGTDSFARVMKKAFADHNLLPQPLAIINVGGAGATIGSRRVKDAKPDGYTMLILHDAIFTAKYSGTVDYGAEVFEPVAGTGQVGMVIAVSEDAPYENLASLMKVARQKPGTINFGANLGALTHYAGLRLEKGWPGAEFQFSQVGGGADRFADLKGGHVEVSGFSIEEFVRFREGGLRGLGYLGNQPHPAAPDVPAARTDEGEPIVHDNMFYWWVPEGTPQNRIDVLAEAIKSAMQTEYVGKKLAEINCEPIFLEGKELSDHLTIAAGEYEIMKDEEPAELPNFVAMVFILLCGLALPIVVSEARTAIRNQSASRDEQELTESAGKAPRLVLAIACFILTMIYVASMSMLELDFRIATILFVVVTGVILARFRFSRLLPITAIAQLVAFGLHFLFTQFFEVDLP